MSLVTAILDLVLEAYNNVEVAKKVALACTTFFGYDILLTLSSEIRYVWSANWGFGRIAFHFNRIWTIAILSVYLPMIFGYNYSTSRCRSVIMFYGYGVVLLIFNTSIVMSLRAWILYDRNPFVFAGLALCCIGGAAACLTILHLDMARATLIANPVPSLITGCLTILPKRITLVPYFIGLSLDTAILIATLYRTWSLNRSGVRLPLIQCLRRDGLFYYVLNCASLFISIAMGVNSSINNIAIGSGYIICLHSTLCSRILLSLRVFNAELQSSAVTGIASSASRTANSFGNDLHLRGKGDGAYQTMGVRKGTHDFDYEMQDRPIELERLQRS